MMCVLVWILGPIIMLMHNFGQVAVFGKIPGFFCAIDFENPGVLCMVSVGSCVLVGSYTIMFFCYYKIYRTLKMHQNQSLALGQQSRLQEDRSLLKYIAAVAFLPTLTDTPVLVAVVLKLYDESLSLDFVFFTAGQFFFMFSVISPLLTLYIIRPIRKEFLRLIKRFVKGPASVSPVANVQLSGLAWQSATQQRNTR